MTRLGVNIDHVATLRNQRDEGYPSIEKAAQIALESVQIKLLFIFEKIVDISVTKIYWLLKRYVMRRENCLILKLEQIFLLPKLLEISNLIGSVSYLKSERKKRPREV